MTGDHGRRPCSLRSAEWPAQRVGSVVWPPAPKPAA